MQIFRPGANSVATLLLASLGAVPVLLIGLVYQVARSPYVTNQNVTREQPVPFGHEYHVGGPGIDCRYCDTSVEKARFAGLPPTSGIVGRNNSDRIVRIDALRRPGAPRPALTDTSVSTCGGDSVRPALDYVSELPRSNGTFDEVRHSPTTARAAILLVTLVLLANRFWRLDSHAIEIRN